MYFGNVATAMDWMLDLKQTNKRKKQKKKTHYQQLSPLSVALCETEGSVYLHLPVEETLLLVASEVWLEAHYRLWKCGQ